MIEFLLVLKVSMPSPPTPHFHYMPTLSHQVDFQCLEQALSSLTWNFSKRKSFIKPPGMVDS